MRKFTNMDLTLWNCRIHDACKGRTEADGKMTCELNIFYCKAQQSDIYLILPSNMLRIVWLSWWYLVTCPYFAVLKNVLSNSRASKVRFIYHFWSDPTEGTHFAIWRPSLCSHRLVNVTDLHCHLLPVQFLVHSLVRFLILFFFSGWHFQFIRTVLISRIESLHRSFYPYGPLARGLATIAILPNYSIAKIPTW